MYNGQNGNMNGHMYRPQGRVCNPPLRNLHIRAMQMIPTDRGGFDLRSVGKGACGSVAPTRQCKRLIRLLVSERY